MMVASLSHLPRAG